MMKTFARQCRKILPDTKPRESIAGLAAVRTIACVGIFAVAIVAGFTLLPPYQKKAERRAQSAAQKSSGTAQSAAPITVKAVSEHPVLSVAVHGETRQKAAIPETVHDALYGKEYSWDARLRYIDNLRETLPSGDVAQLIGYLRQATPEDGLNRDQRLAFSNDIIFALRSQKPAPAELTGLLAGIFNDKTRDPGMRDYAIQHLSEWRWNAVQRNPADAAQIDNILWAAASEPGQPYSGTALLALRRLVADTKMPDHPRYAAEYSQRLAQSARAIAGNDKAALAARISAIGICTETPSPENAALLTGLLSKQDTPPTLQLAALGALIKTIPAGNPLETDTRTLLETAARSAYPPLQRLAATTLRNHTL